MTDQTIDEQVVEWRNDWKSHHAGTRHVQNADRIITLLTKERDEARAGRDRVYKALIATAKAIDGVVPDKLDETNRWLPISEAPRDGTKYLLSNPGTNQMIVGFSYKNALGEYEWRAIGAKFSVPIAFEPTHFQYITPPEASDD